MKNINNFIKPSRSFWMASTSKVDYPSLNEDITVDVAIVGGGITGISCAYLLKKENLKVAVLEADRVAMGTTGHTTAKITSQHELIYNKLINQMGVELARQYADANQWAIREIKKIIDEEHINCDYVCQPAFVYTAKDENVQKIHDEAKAASSLGIKAFLQESIPFNIPVKSALKFEDQAQFHPLKYILAIAKTIPGNDSAIYEQTRAVDIEEGQGYIITTGQGKKVTAKKVIIASHYPFYNKPGMYFSRIYTERSYVIAVKALERYPGGMYINAEEPARSLRFCDSDDGELVLVGGDHHKTGQGGDTMKHYEALEDFAKELFTIQDIPYHWSTQDCMTMDSLPYVGNFTSKTPDLYVATGFAKWGMTNSMVSGAILKDLIVEGKSKWQDVYNPSRKDIMASAKNFIVENLNVAQQLVDGKLSPVDEEAHIKPLEGRVIEVNGDRTGAYRDEEGKLHLVNTTCTHMGCELNWNSAEKSWDCPCHGSRFSYDGQVIEGPAIKPLVKNEDVNTIMKLLNEDF